MKIQPQKTKNASGFTLIELLVVISIIALLASVVLIGLNSARIKARNTKRKADIAQLRKAIETYFQDNGFYPDAGTTPNREIDAQNLAPELVPKYISQIPRDPSGTSQNYEFVYSNGAGIKQEYGVMIPFANEIGGTSCMWRSAGGSQNWWKVGPVIMPDCNY